MSQKEFGFSTTDKIDEYCPESKKEIVIGNDVWIGANCIIFEGVTIGDGAVIGAGSIIRKDVPPYAVVVGVDKLVKYRSAPEIIEELLRIKWRQWEDTQIKEHLDDMYDSKDFIKRW